MVKRTQQQAGQPNISDSTDEYSETIIPHLGTTLSNQKTSYRVFLNQLAGDLMGEILSYLIPRDIKSALFSNHRFYKELKNTGALDYLKT